MHLTHNMTYPYHPSNQFMFFITEANNTYKAVALRRQQITIMVLIKHVQLFQACIMAFKVQRKQSLCQDMHVHIHMHELILLALLHHNAYAYSCYLHKP